MDGALALASRGLCTLSWLQPSVCCAEVNHMSVDGDLACLQVDVLSLQSERLAFPEPESQRQEHEHLQANVIFYGS